MANGNKMTVEYAAANPDDPEVKAWLQQLLNSTLTDRLMAKRIVALQAAQAIPKNKSLVHRLLVD
jgi:hypothetical protein